MNRTLRDLMMGFAAFVLIAQQASAGIFESTGPPLTGLDLQKISTASQPLPNDDSLRIAVKAT